MTPLTPTDLVLVSLALLLMIVALSGRNDPPRGRGRRRYDQ